MRFRSGLEMRSKIEKKLDSFSSVSYFLLSVKHHEESTTNATLSRQFEYTVPGGKTFSLARDRGIEYSASGHRKVKLSDQINLALLSRHYSRRNTMIALIGNPFH